MSVVLEARGVHKQYRLGRTVVPVLGGVDFAVQPGESVAVVGRSGAGKSTLLHVLGGLDPPDQGTVAFQGRSLYGPLEPGAWLACSLFFCGVFPPIGLYLLIRFLRQWRGPHVRSRPSRGRSGDLGFVFQSYHLLPEMDVVENVMLPALARSGVLTPRGRVVRRARELLAVVGLEDRMRHRPQELSGGEQQRVALARSLMCEPRVVLADEPTGNLDNETGSQVLDYLFSLTRDQGHALVLVTHDAQTAAACDRVLHLENGLLRPA
jgi:predicted ABC-type transport system involved in lysophospholipase L1 biosynthesis ATPase subunit